MGCGGRGVVREPRSTRDLVGAPLAAPGPRSGHIAILSPSKGGIRARPCQTLGTRRSRQSAEPLRLYRHRLESECVLVSSIQGQHSPHALQHRQPIVPVGRRFGIVKEPLYATLNAFAGHNAEV